MKIYQQGPRQGVFDMMVCPGGHEPAECPSDWFREDGSPIMFNIRFENGKAEVPGNLGRYMIKHEMAFRSPLILPAKPQLIAA